MTFEDCFEYNEEEIEFEVDFTVVNGGIGSYEFWGQKCVDNQPEIEINSVKAIIECNQNVVDKYVEENRDSLIEKAWEVYGDRD